MGKPDDPRDVKERAAEAANKIAGEVAAAFRADPKDYAAHREALQDLKLTTARAAADLAGAAPDDALVWKLAADLPDYSDKSLYQARSSLVSLACAIFIGWILGGFVATLLGFLGLGGEILRPCAILACVWLEEYLAVNPSARKIMLAVLGLGALGRFAAALASGLVRFGSIRSLIFGAGPRPNIFKTAWLWFGATLLLVFFSRKSTGLDIASFQRDLAAQICGRLTLLRFVFRELQKRDDEIAAMTAQGRSGDSGACPKKDCPLAKAALSLLDSLGPDQAAWLADALRQAGYEPKGGDSGYLIWNDETAGEYEPVGLVKNGDRCLILKRPYEKDGELVPGRAQRLPEV